jgi:Glutathione S-transferase, N-terminal domain
MSSGIGWRGLRSSAFRIFCVASTIAGQHIMAGLKVYGVAGSRAYRTLWMVNELGLEYEHIPIRFEDASTQFLDYLAVNPNGRIPAIDDDGFKLWESMAINLYLAKKHDGLWPKTLEGEAQALQWSFWAMTEVERPALTVLVNRVFLPEEKRGGEAASRPLEGAGASSGTDRISGELELFGRRSQCRFGPGVGAHGARRSLAISAGEGMAERSVASAGCDQSRAAAAVLSSRSHIGRFAV